MSTTDQHPAFTPTVRTPSLATLGHAAYKRVLDDEWPESIFHHVGSQSASYPVSVQ